MYVAMNGNAEAVTFRVPRSPGGKPWRRVNDTAAASPADFIPEGEGEIVKPRTMLELPAFSLVVLVAS